MYKLRPSVSLVDLGDNVLEFFKTNTRKAIKLKVQDDVIKNIVLSLDGDTSIDEISKKYKFDSDSEEAKNLFSYLKKKSILANDALVKNRDDYMKYRRVIHFLEDFAESDTDLFDIWENIRSSRVVIIGTGAVGSWVAANLVQSGVKRLVLIDKDNVELSNIHRQFGFTENDIGKSKTETIKRRLLEFEPLAEIDIYDMYLEENTLNRIEGKIDLIINCADKPSVDQTSKWVGKFCMKHNIPHIVGGGYNMHLSLIGPTIIPYESACVNCFDEQLKEINSIEGKEVKKLQIKNRKLGSFGSMCTVIAAMVGMESLKVLSKHIKPDNINRRGEFDIYDMSIKYRDFEKLDECSWCGGKMYEGNNNKKCNGEQS